MSAMLEAAVRAGLAEIAFTDHLDIDYPSWEHPFSVVNEPAYLSDIEAMRRRFPQIRIRTGFEFGDTPASRQTLRDIIARNTLDFVLLSCHVVDGRDPYVLNEHYFDVHYPTKQLAYDAYIDALIATAQAWEDVGYSSFAHIGYVAKAWAALDKGGHADRRILYEEHPERIDAVLRSIIRADAALEVNTSGYRSIGDALPSFSIVRRFAQLGGQCVTLGSDAHTPFDVARHLNTGRAMALEAGIRWVATFEAGIRKERPL